MTYVMTEEHKNNLSKSKKEKFVFVPNKYIYFHKHIEIILQNRKGQDCAITKIDIKDFDLASKRRWSFSRGYAFNGTPRVKLHQLLIGKKEGLEIDHINGDKLDNRRSNLRHLKHSENIMNDNSRRYKGYYWNEQHKKWRVTITKDTKKYHIGYYKKEEDAKLARKEALEKYYPNLI